MIHRFFVESLENSDMQLSTPGLVNQIGRVLRMRVGELIALFDGQGGEAMYKIAKIEPKVIELQYIESTEPNILNKEVYLAWSLLKKDKNDWVLQKCTELGITRFLPIVTERTEKTGFDIDRAQKIVVEASEQCGRHDIPSVAEPASIGSVVERLTEVAVKYYADMFSKSDPFFLPLRNDSGEGQSPAGSVTGGRLVLGGQKNRPDLPTNAQLVFVGPEGGWSDKERAYFAEQGIQAIGLGQFTLRAETACIIAASKLVG
jgi:16S rRNA (uracil1498-N3)-methyltransferase